jgi:CheY-like chemotaxis protein
MPKKIFIVDDSKIVRQLVRGYLEDRLKHVICSEAVDGLDAVERARELHPDLIVLDFCMPRMNGLEAAAILHNMFPDVPLILYTLHTEIISYERTKAVGISDVVSKMDELDVLLNRVVNFVGSARTVTA